ncbi:biotin carboxylase [Scytonema sp. PCC 10023]|uniref:biotin carboxylase n=1 Tax=Scytonema sp. PCC 10023 TaxID=1680591 RepID=UPI0039C6A6BB
MEKKNRLLSLLNLLPLAIKNFLELTTQYSGLLKVIFISCVIGVLSWVLTPSAVALTQIKLSNLSYHECPQELAKGAVTSGGSSMAANCFIVTGKAQNGTNKTVYDADIFGRIYDANNDSVMQNRTRLGSIEEIPPGDSDFELRISVPANQPLPLKLKQFKAAGFGAQVRK